MSRIHKGDQAFDGESLYGTEVEMPYSGTRSFMRRRLTRNLEGVDYAVLGVPFDLSVSGRPGARFGPLGLRNASSQLAWGKVWPWDLDPFDRLAVVDYGDVSFRRGQSDQMLDGVYEQARRILSAGARLIMLGGDHLTTYPVLKAHAERYGPVAMIHFDAHRDLVESDYLDHGTFMYHAMREGLIDPGRSIQIGIRTWYEKNDPVRVLYRPWVRENGAAATIDEIKRAVGDRPTYLSFDIDAVDPAFAPGTGTPVVDGLTPGEVFDVIRGLVEVDIVGMDMVEVSPPYDAGEVTSLFGASVVLEYLCTRAARQSAAAAA